MHTLTRPLAALALSLTVFGFAAGCQPEGGELSVRTAELASAPGLQVTITGAGALAPEQVQAITAQLETTGRESGSAMVRMTLDDEGASTLEIELWGEDLPDADAIPALLRAAVPALADAKIAVAQLPAGTGPTPIAIEVVDEGLDAEATKAQIVEQLRADGVEGTVEVEVSDDDEGRRVEIRVEDEVTK